MVSRVSSWAYCFAIARSNLWKFGHQSPPIPSSTRCYMTVDPNERHDGFREQGSSGATRTVLGRGWAHCGAIPRVPFFKGSGRRSSRTNSRSGCRRGLSLVNSSTALPKDRALIHLQRNPPHLGPRPVIADRHGETMASQADFIAQAEG